jgi:purine catabolism regulator
MPPRVRDVAGLPELRLSLLAGAGSAALDAPVRWVATSELGDPGPYLEGGELLLTTGMRLPAQDAAGAAAYVDRLVAAEVAALGFGVGPIHDVIPAALVQEAARAGLPLLEVPLETPFIAVSKAVSRLLAAEEYDEAARGLAAQRELIRTALGTADAAPAVLRRLVRHLGGFALLLDGAGEVLHADPATARGRAEEIREEALRLRPKGLRASSVLATAQDYVVLQPLGVQGRTRGLLAVGSDGPLRPGDQAVVNLAVSLLSLDLARGHGGDAAAAGVRAAAMRLLLAGRLTQLPLVDLGWTAVTGDVRVLAARPSTEGEDVAVERIGQVLPGSAAAAGVADDPGLVVVVTAADAPLDLLRQVVEEADGGLQAVGVGDVADVGDADALARSLARARRALGSLGALGPAGSGERGVRGYDELGGGLDGLLDPAAADAWAVALLAPLDAPGERGELAATLRAWLTRHGQVDAAASDLGVHRHTVRHRLRRAEALLGRSLDDPGVRAELFLALSRRPPPFST